MTIRSIASLFALAAAVGAGSSHAVTLNPRGLGQVLIYPYYTVNKNQATLLSIVNASDVGKFAKLYVHEGYNGRIVLDMDLFLSPHDVWTAALTQVSDDGGAQLVTADRSCTSPPIPAGGVAFSSSFYDGQLGLADGGPTGIERTREGFVELITIGDIAPSSPLDIATTHVQNGTPDTGTPSCDSNAVGGNNPISSAIAPTDGLSGSASIVDVGQGTFFAYNAAALAGFSDVVLFGPSVIPFPTLQVANSHESSVPGGAVAYLSTNSGRSLALDYSYDIDAVSAVFAADAIYNEYLVDPQLGSQTDWVVTLPTKSYYTDPMFVGSAAIAPFVETFGQIAPNQSNVSVGMKVYDREEGTPASFGTPATAAPMLSYQVNVVSFSQAAGAGQASPVLGSKLVSAYVPPYGTNGWASMDLASGDGGHHFRPAADGTVVSGLPVTGFMVYNVVNANAQAGVLANYSGAFPHRSTISYEQTAPN